MDGVFSALFAYNQLKKQGFTDKTIKLNSIQYGARDEESAENKINPEEYEAREKEKEDVKKKGGDIYKIPKKEFKPKKGEALVVVDFAALPDEVVAQFVSDHHADPDKKLKQGKAGGIGRIEFASDAEHVAISYAGNIADSTTIKAVSQMDSAKFTNLFNTLNFPTEYKNKGRMERLAIIVNSLLSKLIKNSPEGVKHLIRTSTPSLVNVYNNLYKEFKLNDLQVQGLREIMAEKPDWNRVDMIRKQLPRGFEVSKDKAKEGGRKEELGTPKEYIEKMKKRGEEDMKIAQTGYFTPKEKAALEKAKEEKRKYIEEFGRGKKSETPEVTSKREALKKEVEDISAEKEKKQGKFHPINRLVIRQDATSTRGYPGRYTASMLSKEGKRFPFTLKRFSTMMQVAVNPDVDLPAKKRINLHEDMKKVLEEIKKKYMTKYNQWAFEIVEKESGGHTQITNISGLGTLGLMVKAKRERLKELEELKDRASKTSKKFSDIMPNKAEEMKKLESEKETNASMRQAIMNDIEMEFYKIIKEKYGDIAVTKPAEKVYDIGKKDEEVKESFVERVLRNLQS